VLFVGRRGGFEERIAPEAGLRLETIAVRGIDTARPLRSLGALLRLPAAVLRARRIIRRFHPDVVVGTAGYVCVPVVLAARSRNVPAMLLEQNAHPGRAVRLLARRVRAVAVSFPETAALLPGARTVHTGNPVRADIAARAPAPLGEQLLHVLVMGGSQGARRLNDAVARCVGSLLEDHPTVRLTHQCGANDAEWAVPARLGLPAEVRERYTVAAFYDDIGERIRAADLVVMRAGGSSLAEVSVLGRPMILVPYPYAGAHQQDNAAPYAAAGAAKVIPDAECSANRLREEIEALIRDPDRWRAMAAASARIGRPDAAERVVELIREVAW